MRKLVTCCPPWTLDLDCLSIICRTFIRGAGIRRSFALAMTSAKHQVWIAMLIQGINIPGAVTIDVIVIYLIVTNVATIPYTKWCKKQLVTQVKP